MDVYSTEQGIQLSFGKTSEFRGGAEPPLGTPLLVQEAGCAAGPTWTGAENVAPTGTRSPNRPARRQSLYRLSYPAHRIENNFKRSVNLSKTCIHITIKHSWKSILYT
jgi:hypothetical protein